jgi:MPBQ/MSBQ methyltransferase
MSSVPRLPAYFDYLIPAFREGAASRHVHLGYWDDPSSAASNADGAFEAAQRRLDEEMIALADTASGHAILDVGCGFGGTLAALNNKVEGSWLAGVNADPRQLAICRQIKPEKGNRIEWQEADAARLPFAAGSFDRVLCIEAMFHFGSRRAFFLEAARVLKPGGALVGSDITLTKPLAPLPVPGLSIEAPLQDGYGPWPDFWCDDADHDILATAAGLKTGVMKDATANTLPSHRFTAPADADDGRDTGNAALRAALMLRWLHTSGRLRYSLFRYHKP